ncbi:MAG: gamma-glutamyl-gamma-aminobutyrate hydrolase family protein [Bacteroidales bacterium]|jgi:putative glutamine amidotransferase|nr:gamma-glutamyl-gamma-aminobutyrate hydrolase family protein [Bacteroidales bacterium]
MKPKRVLIVSSRMQCEGKTVQWVPEVYPKLLMQYGIVPVIVPTMGITPKILQEYLNNYDGLLLIEGGDVHPQRYSDTWNENDFKDCDTLKDEIEFQCFAHAYIGRKPILGIGRGMHVINVALGGTLAADIHQHRNAATNHIDYDKDHSLCNEIEIAPRTPLMYWYKRRILSVNSSHNQRIGKLGDYLIDMAHDAKGVINGIYIPHYPFLIGLQFHLGSILDEDEDNKLVLMKFIDAVSPSWSPSAWESFAPKKW